MNDINYFSKVVNPFKAVANRVASKRKYQVYFKIEINKLGQNQHPYFSIHGVHGPLSSGNSMGSCGQNIDDYINLPEEEISYNKGWNRDLYLELISLWKENHLHTVEPNSDYYNELVSACEKFPKSNRVFGGAWRSYNN